MADELILTLNDKQPMLATVKELTDNRVELRWMVKDVPTSSMAIGVSNAGKIDVNFRGRLLLNTMRVQVRASIKGNETGGGDGTCHLIRQ